MNHPQDQDPLDHGLKNWQELVKERRNKVVNKVDEAVKKVTYPTKNIFQTDERKPVIKKEAVETEPVVEPKTKPAPAPSEPTPKRDPWHPPRPAHEPRPQAKSSEPSLNEDEGKKKLVEAYEDQVHPAVQSHWKNIRKPESKHPFSKHPFMAVYGDTLSRQGYEETGNEPMSREMMIKMFHSLNNIKRIEAPHKEELENLAKDIIVEIWGIPREMLDGEISEDTQEGYDTSSPEEDNEIPDDVRKYINKNISLNTLTQGAAVHQMKSMHHLIRERLTEIDPELVPAYDELTRLMHRHNWWVDPDMFGAMLNQAAVGKSQVQWEEDANGVEQPKIKAKGWIFPFLAQELSKGAMKLLTHHGHSKLDPEIQRQVVKHGDKLAFEPWQIQIGPTLWKKFLKLVPKDVKLSELIPVLSEMEPDDVHTLLANIVDNPDDAKEAIKQLAGDEGGEQ